MVEDWGTARERQRRRRRWKWVVLVIVAAIAAPIVAAFVLGIVDGYTGQGAPGPAPDRRAHIGYVGMALAVLVAVTVQYRLWRAADEVERGQINIALGLAGIVALSTLPVLSLAAKPLALPNPAMLGWSLSAATLLGTRIVQRIRG